MCAFCISRRLGQVETAREAGVPSVPSCLCQEGRATRAKAARARVGGLDGASLLKHENGLPWFGIYLSSVCSRLLLPAPSLDVP